MMRGPPGGNATSLIVSVPRFAMRSCQAMIGVPSLAWRFLIFAAARRRLCRPHDRGALGGARLVIGEQDRRQGAAHVVLDIVGQHAQEHVRLHATVEPVEHRPHSQVDTLERAERTLDERQALVGGDRRLRADFVLGQAGADHVDAVEPRLVRDLLLATLEREAAVAAMSSAKCFFILRLSITASTASPILAALKSGRGRPK